VGLLQYQFMVVRWLVYQPDTITTYPHTHTFENLPLTLTDTNESTRNSAKNQGINGESRVIASPQFNTSKKWYNVPDF
jgi:hypothetical protein